MYRQRKLAVGWVKKITKKHDPASLWETLLYNWRPPDPAGTRYNKRHNTVPHIIPLRILICIDTYQLICGLSYGPEAKSLWFRNNSKIPSQKNQQEILAFPMNQHSPPMKLLENKINPTFVGGGVYLGRSQLGASIYKLLKSKKSCKLQKIWYNENIKCFHSH